MATEAQRHRGTERIPKGRRGEGEKGRGGDREMGGRLRLASFMRRFVEGDHLSPRLPVSPSVFSVPLWLFLVFC
jgi:hypothetical protein